MTVVPKSSRGVVFLKRRRVGSQALVADKEALPFLRQLAARKLVAPSVKCFFLLRLTK